MGVLFTFGEHLVFLSHYNSQTQKQQGLHLKFLIWDDFKPDATFKLFCLERNIGIF